MSCVPLSKAREQGTYFPPAVIVSAAAIVNVGVMAAAIAVLIASFFDFVDAIAGDIASASARARSNLILILMRVRVPVPVLVLVLVLMLVLGRVIVIVLLLLLLLLLIDFKY